VGQSDLELLLKNAQMDFNLIMPLFVPKNVHLAFSIEFLTATSQRHTR